MLIITFFLYLAEIFAGNLIDSLTDSCIFVFQTRRSLFSLLLVSFDGCKLAVIRRGKHGCHRSVVQRNDCFTLTSQQGGVPGTVSEPEHCCVPVKLGRLNDQSHSFPIRCVLSHPHHILAYNHLRSTTRSFHSSFLRLDDPVVISIAGSRVSLSPPRSRIRWVEFKNFLGF